MVKEGYGDDLKGLSEHFGDLPMEDIETALAFYRLFPEQIDAVHILDLGMMSASDSAIMALAID